MRIYGVCRCLWADQVCVCFEVELSRSRAVGVETRFTRTAGIQGYSSEGVLISRPIACRLASVSPFRIRPCTYVDSSLAGGKY
jgi:hypothetical protein